VLDTETLMLLNVYKITFCKAASLLSMTKSAVLTGQDLWDSNVSTFPS